MTTSEIKVLDINTGQSCTITKDEKASEPNWLGDGKEIIWLKSHDKGTTQMVVGEAEEDGGRFYVAGTIEAPIANLKLTSLGIGSLAIAVSGQAKPDGSIHNPENVTKPHSSGRLYKSLFVRYSTKLSDQNRNAIFYGSLRKSAAHITESTGRWRLTADLTNALAGTGLESPIPPFGGKDHFDISDKGLIFVAKDPSLNPATSTKTDFYFIRISNFTSIPSSMPQRAVVKSLRGASTSPVFSPDGKQAAFLQMKIDGYESDRYRIILAPDVSDLSTAVELPAAEKHASAWSLSPSSVFWSTDCSYLYLQAEDTGRGRLFRLPIFFSGPDSLIPEIIVKNGYVSDVQPASSYSSQLFVSSTSLIDNSLYSIVDPSMVNESRLISSNSRNGLAFGLSEDQVSEIWYPGAGEYKVHAWVFRPSTYDKNETYPLALLIHGGPQGAWSDSWSTRWNPAVFAEQGCVVVAPNVTGSTSYGQEFVNGIKKQWGGRPYEDIVQGFDYIKQNLSYIDTDRAVALGASYGGYMMNYIQGQPLGRKLKALVTHDGVFSMINQLSSEEQYFPNHDLGGPLWEARSDWEKWDPSRFVGNWGTPHLIIHNDRDYRLANTEGLAAFNVLQERGVDSQYLTFPDENHFVLNPENSLMWHTVVLNWINKYVGLPPYKQDDGGYEVKSLPQKQLEDLKLGKKSIVT
ncbi:MAG: hypothetical protein M1827_004305 [Pycnora praestabilis]|nr:MAG: hypothetical protein M1827_004305 [Pycnora praestabilis]